MKIRLDRSNDKTQYLAVQKEAFPTLNTKRDELFFMQKVKKKEIFAAEQNGEYAGHLCFSYYPFNPPFIDSVFIELLTVRKVFRGNGFGTALVEHLVRYCRKRHIPVIHLSAEKGRRKTEAYYKKQGFRKVGFLEDAVPSKEWDQPQIFYAVEVKRWKPPFKRSR